MHQSFRQTALIATAIVGLGTASAVAAPPGAADPTATGGTRPSTMAPAATMPPSSTMAPSSSTMAPAGQAQANSGQPNGGQKEANIEQRISDLQSKLQITPAQKPQWDRFTQIMRDNARDMDKVFESRVQSMDSMNAEANMKSYAMVANHHAQDVQKLVPAFDALYAKMSESQKKTADEVFREDANKGNPGRNG